MMEQPTGNGHGGVITNTPYGTARVPQTDAVVHVQAALVGVTQFASSATQHNTHRRDVHLVHDARIQDDAAPARCGRRRAQSADQLENTQGISRFLQPHHLRARERKGRADEDAHGDNDKQAGIVQ